MKKEQLEKVLQETFKIINFYTGKDITADNEDVITFEEECIVISDNGNKKKIYIDIDSIQCVEIEKTSKEKELGVF
ncbi:hypothetical protein [Tepidibacter aestuarii]|uniref:hypothetical protein n=1 Tax=Tepidibacter aestuarii TaxID=2925782 RepID=UPI0020C08BEB|nr:hypothetical protein [Tepidibacter aestuarii]CAH2213263.1 protein of unknown function [Tepidibacter aestuarii]